MALDESAKRKARRQLDFILDSGCYSLASATIRMIGGVYKIVKNKRRPQDTRQKESLKRIE